MKRIQDRISSLVKGCKCVTGCTTNRCKCRKMTESCSAGCECINCNNTSSFSRNTTSHQDTSSSRDIVIAVYSVYHMHSWLATASWQRTAASNWRSGWKDVVMRKPRGRLSLQRSLYSLCGTLRPMSIISAIICSDQ